MRTPLYCAATVLASVSICTTPPVLAGTIIDHSVKGAITEQGLNNAIFNAAPGNVLVGASSGSNPTRRNYFVFDLTGIAGDVAFATLVVESPSGSYFSPQPTETWTLYDFASSIAILQDQSSISVSAYSDLGTGVEYGSREVSEADEGIANGAFNPVAVDLNAAAVADINAASGGLFAIGGALTSLSGTDGQFFFGFSSNNQGAWLDLTLVPEPGAMLLAFAALSAVALVRDSRLRGNL